MFLRAQSRRYGTVASVRLTGVMGVCQRRVCSFEPGRPAKAESSALMTVRVASLLVAIGVLLVTGAYRHLTSYLARFTPMVGGL